MTLYTVGQIAGQLFRYNSHIYNRKSLNFTLKLIFDISHNEFKNCLLSGIKYDFGDFFTISCHIQSQYHIIQTIR